MKELIIKKAFAMRTRAIAPFSKYRVGAAIETQSGKIIGGCNIESSSFSLTCCAERVTLFRALAEGYTVINDSWDWPNWHINHKNNKSKYR